MNKNREIKIKTFGIFNFVNGAFMCLVIAVTAYPVLYVLFASISDPADFASHKGLLFYPLGFSLEPYKLVMKHPLIMRSYLNTIIILVLGTATNMLFTSVGAYVLSRKNLKFMAPIMIMIAFTMFFTGGIIPNYILVNNMLKMGNSYTALIIPGAISTYNLIVMRTYFQGLPDSLEESAKVDGATDFTVLFRIILPVSAPIIAVMILFYGVGHWNSWFPAMLYIREREMFPLQLIMREILLQNSSDSMVGTITDTSIKADISESIKYSVIVIATLPIVTIYPFLQKYFVQGIMVGSLKG